MRKVIVTFLCLLPIFAYAANMCVKDETMVVVLDPTLTGTTLSTDTDAGTWSIQFDYGVVSGIAHCGSLTGSAGQAFDTVTGGRGCYCKMLRPAESKWIWTTSINGCTVDTCTTQCANILSGSVANSLPARQGMYSNAGI